MSEERVLSEKQYGRDFAGFAREVMEKDLLSRNGFKFKKQYGQNFLSDKNLLGAIARDSGAAGETVLEIGAGAGALTLALCEIAARVVSFEIDRSLQDVLKETLNGRENVQIVFRDFMKEDLSSLEEKLGKYLVCANLPYYVTTPVVMKFVEESKNCRSLTLMVQEEVARRFCAKAGTPDYGAVTAAIARRGEAKLLRKVSKDMFTPRPKVDSAVVRLDFQRGGFEVKSAECFKKTLRIAFSSRRKTLENNLMAGLSLSRGEAKELLGEAGIEEGVRGETLPPEELGALSDHIFDAFGE